MCVAKTSPASVRATEGWLPVSAYADAGRLNMMGAVIAVCDGSNEPVKQDSLPLRSNTTTTDPWLLIATDGCAPLLTNGFTPHQVSVVPASLPRR